MTFPDPRIKEAILHALKAIPGTRFGIVFGSFASGRPHESSDVDIAVDAGRSLTAAEKMAIVTELASRLGRPVDLVDLHNAGEPLLGQILKYGIPILGSKTEYANLIRKHVLDEADFAPYRRRILLERRRAWTGN